MKINGDQRKRLEDALCSAFPSWSDLKRLVAYVLDENLEKITAREGLTTVVFELVKWAESRGCLAPLLFGAYQEAPGNEQLSAVFRELRIQIQANAQDFGLVEMASHYGVYTSRPNQSYLIGRDAELLKIKEYIQGESAYSFINIYGTSGIGKSVLASHLWNCPWASEPYQLIWISCDRLDSLEKALRGIALLLGRVQMSVEDLLGLLEKEPYLMVFDGADGHMLDSTGRRRRDSFLPGLVEFLLRLSPQIKGKVLITAWNKLPCPMQLPIWLRPLNSVDAFSLFLKIWGKMPAELDRIQNQDVEMICEKANHLPQLITMIAFSMQDQEDITLSIEDLAEKMITDHSSTYELVFQRLADQTKDLLCRMSLFEGPISMRVINRISSVDPELENPEEIVKQLEINHWLQKVDEAHYQLHYNLRTFLRRYQFPDLPLSQRKVIYRETARCLLDSKMSKDWFLGVKYLFEIERWEDFICHVQDRFLVLETNPNLFAGAGKTWLRHRAYWFMAYLYYRFEDKQKAASFAKQGKNLPYRRSGDPMDELRHKALLLRFNIIFVYASMYLDANKDKAKDCLEDARQICEQLSPEEAVHLKHEVASYKLVKALYLCDVKDEEEVPDYATALHLTREAADVFREMNDWQYYVRARSNEATILCEGAGDLDLMDGLEESIKISKEILNIDRSKVMDLSLIASEYTNLVFSLIDAGDFNQADQYAEIGLKFCRETDQFQPSIATAYKILLMNAVDVDLEIADVELETVLKSRIDHARDRLSHAQTLMTLSGKDVSDQISLHAAWAKICAKEALFEENAARKDKKDVEMRSYYRKAKGLLLQSSDKQDEKVVKKLEEWLTARSFI